MKHVLNKKIMNPLAEKPMQINYSDKPDGARDMMTADAIRTFISQAYPNQVPQGSPLKAATFEDSEHTYVVLEALRPFKLLSRLIWDDEAPKHIDLEEAEYKWLLAGFKERGPALFGVLAKGYVDALEDLKKIHEPQNGKNRVEEKVAVA